MMSSHAVMVPSPHSDGLLQVGECVGTLVGEEYQLGQGTGRIPSIRRNWSVNPSYVTSGAVVAGEPKGRSKP